MTSNRLFKSEVKTLTHYVLTARYIIEIVVDISRPSLGNEISNLYKSTVTLDVTSKNIKVINGCTIVYLIVVVDWFFYFQILRDRSAVALRDSGEQPQNYDGPLRHVDCVPVDLNATGFPVSSLQLSARFTGLHDGFQQRSSYNILQHFLHDHYTSTSWRHHTRMQHKGWLFRTRISFNINHCTLLITNQQ